MATFRIHYEALEAPRFLAGERHTADVDAKNPDEARKSLRDQFDRLHKGCKPHVHKVKLLKGGAA